MRDVYAAGDATAFPLKQGGLATQQADAVAEAVAARIGALPREPEPFRPVLRGLLLTGGAPLYLRAELGPAADPIDQRAIVAGRRLVGEPSTHALWWPPGKVAGRYLAPMLADARPLTPAEAPLLDRTAPRHDTEPGDQRASTRARPPDRRSGRQARGLRAGDPSPRRRRRDERWRAPGTLRRQACAMDGSTPAAGPSATLTLRRRSMNLPVPPTHLHAYSDTAIGSSRIRPLQRQRPWAATGSARTIPTHSRANRSTARQSV